MDILATILSAILIWGVAGVGVATAWTLRRVIATRNMIGRKWSTHSAHILTDAMIHYRPPIRRNVRRMAGNKNVPMMKALMERPS